MIRVLPFALVIALLAAGTIWQGKLSDRWSVNASEELKLFAHRLDGVPTEIDNWTLNEEQELKQEEWEASNCAAYVSRDYINEDGDQVSMFLVAGSGRNVTIHTPDQCYVGAGFEMEKDPEQCEVMLDNARHDQAQFATTIFRKDTPTHSERLLILWAYSDSGQWESPNSPKPVYGMRPALYKVYLITPIPLEGSHRALESASAKFARELMPVLTETLFPPEEENGQNAADDEAAEAQ